MCQTVFRYIRIVQMILVEDPVEENISADEEETQTSKASVSG